MNGKKHIFNSLIALTLAGVFWFLNRSAEILRSSFEAGRDMVAAMDGIGSALLKKPFRLSLDLTDLAVAGITVVLALSLLGRPKKFRPGEEHGSARFGTTKDIRVFIDPIPDNNIILTATESLTMNSRPKNPDLARNKNVLVIGGSGSGKTRFYVKPNLLQMHSTYVLTDPKGTLLEECGHALEVNGYEIRVLNLNGGRGMKQSQGYNPFAYIRNESDILKLVNVLMTNTNGEGKQSGDKFWQDAEQLYYCALIGYLWTDGDKKDQNMQGLLELHNNAEASEQNEALQSPLDVLFEELEEKNPDCFAVRQYRKFKKAAGKTLKGILISAGARLGPFDIAEVRELMTQDELELDKLGDRKTALFVITSDTDKTFNFIAAMMYSQMFNLLCDKALEDYGGKLPIHVRCILDEFANIGRIPNFEEIISVIRSREISANVILQSKAQLETIYDKKADIIVDNCDTMLFLGGRGKVLEEVVKILGKQTIDLWNDGKSRGTSSSDSTNYQKTGRELMTVDELGVMPRSDCICHITNLRPFRSKKYRLEDHPRFSLLSDADRRNRYTPYWMREEPIISPDDQVEIFE